MMNAFQLKEYWRYRRAAKGRHGVHSPAVYRFIDEALRPSGKHFRNSAMYRSDSGACWNADGLMLRIGHHFHFREIITPAADGADGLVFRPPGPAPYKQLQDSYDRLYDWRTVPPEIWVEWFRKDCAQPGQKDMIVVHGIHQSALHAEAWRGLSTQPEVRLSIDLFRVGLLFFSNDFKERQHFVLKYPA